MHNVLYQNKRDGFLTSLQHFNSHNTKGFIVGGGGLEIFVLNDNQPEHWPLRWATDMVCTHAILSEGAG